MVIISRRNFLAQMSGVVLMPLAYEKPELILYNGNFITVDPAQPRAQAVAIANGRFLAVGSNDDIRALSTARTTQINLGGKTVTPGFIDAHTHLAYSGKAHLRNVDCDLRTIDAIKKVIRERAAKTPPGEWVLGFKYDDTKTKEGRPLNFRDLDEAAPNHPVMIDHRGGHTSYVNTAAYKKAGITESTPDPQGGKFGRDSEGKLNGKILERASRAFNATIPSQYTDDDYREGVKLISKMLSKSGITSAHDAGISTRDLMAFQDARANGDLTVRVYCLMRLQNFERVNEAGMRTGFGDNMIRIGALKITCDGSISERTARLSQPYVGRPDDYGILINDEEALYEEAKKGYDAGWQIGIHANGDTGIDITLKVYERLMRENPKPDPRFRLEHCTVINDDLVRRIKNLGAIPCPFSTYVYFHGDKMHEYGDERLKSMFAVRSFLDAGVKITQTSDYPPGPYEPMMAIQSSVTRTDMWGKTWGANQKVTVEEAIKVGTLHGAYASFEENTKGSIEEGKLADLVVLGKDITKIDPFSIIDTPIERTMLSGKWVYEG